ncbi:MAG TPA: hypothetical protein VGD43_16480 [Micromonospora sp.]
MQQSTHDRAAGPRILALWSAPRSRSTAFFRMMAERGDFQPVHEPFSVLAEQGVTEVGGRQLRDEAAVLAALRELAGQRPVFFKDTTDARYPGVLADDAFLATDATHVFLIRHPRLTVPSYHRLNPEVGRDNIGFGNLHEIFTAVRERTGRIPVVLDAEELVADPRTAVKLFCAAIGVPFDPSALTWAPGDRSEWRATRRWHVEVSRSDGLRATVPTSTVDVDADPVLRDHVAHNLPCYEALYAHRLRVAPQPSSLRPDPAT